MPALWWAALATGAVYLGVVFAQWTGLVRGIKVVPALLLAGLFAHAHPWMVAGLVCSAAGDAFLLDKKRFMLPGLVSFLVGHLCFIATFRAITPAAPATGVIVCMGVAVLGMVRILLPKSGTLRFAVPVYGVTLGAMSVVASTLGPLAFAGALTFVFSDAFLAFTLFKRPIPRGDLVVMSSYYAALLTLAAAVLRAG